MRGWLKIAGAVAALGGVATIAGVGVGVSSADSPKTVHTRGDEVLQPNKRISADLRFSPGPVTIQSGETVTWANGDKTGAPHTVTLATPDALVSSFEDMFFEGSCPACDAAIGAALGAHFGGGAPAADVDDGDGEFNDPGDSVLFFPDAPVTKEINAPAGTTLNYFCAIHPWMQGTINVQG